MAALQVGVLQEAFVRITDTFISELGTHTSALAAYGSLPSQPKLQQGSANVPLCHAYADHMRSEARRWQAERQEWATHMTSMRQEVNDKLIEVCVHTHTHTHSTHEPLSPSLHVCVSPCMWPCKWAARVAWRTDSTHHTGLPAQVILLMLVCVCVCVCTVGACEGCYST